MWWKISKGSIHDEAPYVFWHLNMALNLETYHATVMYLFTKTDYFEYFAPDFSLYPDIAARIENQNTKQVHVNREPVD